jgi:hypothetical protein
MDTHEQQLLKKIRQLDQDRAAEVEDFVDFLRTRQEDEKLTKECAKACEPGFARVWDNDEDAIYDRD